MKNSPLFPALAIVLFIMTSCGGNPPADAPKTTPPPPPPAEEVCTYTYDNVSTIVAWTAYKHSGKVGVNGKLEAFEVTTTGTPDAPQKILDGLTFKIMMNAINSEDPVRDKKLMQIFFGTLHTDTATGSITSFKGNTSGGTGVLNLNMNNVDKAVDFTYTIKGNDMTLKASLNFNRWNGEAALAALGTACEAKHTGEDGVTKLWPDADIAITTKLKKKCE